ncbi:hypothetical protein GALMADRAFT_386332 [Galerina marginata CBS 339.88]|uniref:Uncharacterized protein n=1 Tax=Galerina marginata (strain CBS 339.88) TaxID=685588 RepID=A0A067TTW4_GALM3|nr:hypothetical protein GALMADRAFT_386332 [Galerina marginata CBS 339.88]
MEEDSRSYVPDTNLEHPPFRLHLVGNGNIDIPDELKNLIVFHTGLNYTEYYHLMGGMDVQASSTIAMCMEVDLPILGLQQLREAYTHIDDDRITITRPAVMSEVDALKALRTGDSSSFLASDPSHSGITLGSHPGTRKAVEEMMQAGWIRSKEGIEACKQNTWTVNEMVVKRILRDI